VGALALKHRINETQKQRIICFVGSTIAEDAETLKIIAKKMKKNGIAVDLICFGDVSDEQKNKVEAFMKSIEHEDNSHSLFIEPGDVYLSEKLIGTKIFSADGGNMGPGGPGNL
jgi:26S proteasome regulatory subunit N10